MVSLHDRYVCAAGTKGTVCVCCTVLTCVCMCVHVCKCVVCPTPIQEGCILALIGLRKAAFSAFMGSTFRVRGEIELILETRKIKASQLIAHQKINYYIRHTESVGHSIPPTPLSNWI